MAYASGPANHGGYGQLNDNCLYLPNDGNFVTQEMWDSSATSPRYWTEVGILSGDMDGNYYSHQWFWADNRPNGGNFNWHASGGTAGAARYSVETTYAGNNEWLLYGGNNFTQVGTSTSQPESSSGYSVWGTEYTDNPGAGMRDVGTIYDMEWENTSGSFNLEGRLATGTNSGPGPFQVTQSYDKSASSVSLAGPC